LKPSKAQDTDLSKHEKAAFLKFFSIYFGSVALLILASGFFYFLEQKKSLIEKEHFSIIEFTRQLKMKMNPQNEHITYKNVAVAIENYHMDNFTIKEDRFEKYMPFSWEGGFFLVTKDKLHYETQLAQVRGKIILVQMLLLGFFAFLSYFLAKKALLPLRNAIAKLDNFSKDIIHDLNTPITSILLNIKLLESNAAYQNNRALERIKRSASDISELHVNLTHLLNEDRLIITQESIFTIVEEVVGIYKKIYPELHFYVEHSYFEAAINKEALKQVLANLISNACKYNKKEGFVKIYKKENALCIEDSGVGIESVERIFERSYSEHKSGHGLGLDIALRLANAMSIKIEVSSKVGEGSCFTLHFTA